MATPKIEELSKELTQHYNTWSHTPCAELSGVVRDGKCLWVQPAPEQASSASAEAGCVRYGGGLMVINSLDDLIAVQKNLLPEGNELCDDCEVITILLVRTSLFPGSIITISSLHLPRTTLFVC